MDLLAGLALIWLVVLSLIHLVLSYKEKKLSRGITKVFLMPSLMLVIYFLKISNGFLYLALSFGCLGDLFMLFKDKKIFLYGGFISFAIGHIFYIYLILKIAGISLNPLWISLYGVAVVFIVIYLASIVLKAKFKNDSWIATIYGAILFTVFVSALILTSARHDLASGFVLFGSLLFIASDVYLGHTIYERREPHENFYIMLPYLLGQYGLALGLAILLMM
ncbi:MAG TPA: lysoplasmalogenase family protein [Bacilli bacterium]|nr:lysoplasmalogenase family protein [Bacilli bacterium]